MILYKSFGELRLVQFVPDVQIEELHNWEFMDRIWVGEAVGFSEWLRLKDDSSTLRSLAISFSELPELAVVKILNKLGLPIHREMSIKQLGEVLGKPYKSEQFCDDRITYEFLFGEPQPYEISCTVLNEGGLSYLVIMIPHLSEISS